MRDLILQALKTAIEKHPEIVEHLTGKAAEVAKDPGRYEKLPKHIGEPYVFTPDYWEITEEDIDRAIAKWDKLMPDYAGMLDAKVEIDPTKTVKDA